MISYNYIYILKEHSDITKKTINIYKTDSKSSLWFIQLPNKIVFQFR